MLAQPTSTEEKWQQVRPVLVEGYENWLDNNRNRLDSSLLSAAMSETTDNLDLPIALRRGKRKSGAISPVKDASTNITHEVATPSRRRPKKVRFSDSNLPSSTSTLASSGLTPHIRRTSLGTPRTHRPTTPSLSAFPPVGTIQFTPFRQVLDDRCKRRIRRNGLSEEMNEYEADKLKQSKTTLLKQMKEKDIELQRLRAEVNTDRAQHNFGAEPLSSQERVEEIEAELEQLRQSFNLEDADMAVQWDDVPTNVRTGPLSDSGDTIRIYEDDNDAGMENTAVTDSDGLTMGLELESARQAKRDLLQASRRSSISFEMHFDDSPVRRRTTTRSPPATPRTLYHQTSKQLKATTSRAEDAEVALQSLENEVQALGFAQDHAGSSGAVTAIANHFRQARLELERLVPGETVSGFENAKLLPEMLEKLKQLAQLVGDREAELKTIRDQQRTLKGNFDHAIIAAEKANARVKDLETSIDNGADDMLHARMRAQALEKDCQEKDRNVASLSNALSKYREDVTRLEELVQQMESEHTVYVQEAQQAMMMRFEHNISDLEAKIAAETRGRQAAEESSISRLDRIKELEVALTTANTHAADVERQIATMEMRVQLSSNNHAEEVGALNARISTLSTALASANAEVDKLKVTKAKLEERVRAEVEQGARTLENIQNDLIKNVQKTYENKKSYIRGAKVRIANWELEHDDDSLGDDVGPMTPASLVRFADMEDNDHVEGSVEMSRGRKHRRTPGLGIKRHGRRRYDSGIGMDSLGEVDEDDNQQGLLTPELSSEPDIEVADQ